MRRDDAVIRDVYHAARLALEFAAGVSKNSFLIDAKTQAAVLHELLVIGEAVKRLSEDFRVSHPEMSWRSMAGMRDQLIHAYDSVDLKEVWITLQRDVPKLLAFLEPFLKEE